MSTTTSGTQRLPRGGAGPGRPLDRSMRRMGWFWQVIVAATLLLGAVVAVSDQPALLHTERGLAMAALIVAYQVWFWLPFAVLWHSRRAIRLWPPSLWQSYLTLSIGLVLTIALLAISPDFFGLIFAFIGLTVSLVRIRDSIVPLAAIAVVYIVFNRNSVSTPNHPTQILAWSQSLFSLVLTIGITFSISALIKQRYEREHLIAELQEAHQWLRASAAQEADLAALRERNRLAREMHDSLGHALVLIAIKIEAAQRLQMVDPARAAVEWEDTKALVRSTMNDLRTSLAGLRLPALDEQPFREAMAGLACELSRGQGVDVSHHLTDCADTLDRPIQEALYRVAQEALANVARHAHACQAALVLSVSAETAVLEVSDDGIGLGNAPRTQHGHYGVIGMRERVEALGGVLTLGPRPDGGAVLRASIPLGGR